MSTERSEEQLAAARLYIETMGQMTEAAQDYPPRLNANCVHCDHRRDCPAYAEALRGERTFVCEDKADLEAVAREREEVARLAKILYARKEELDAVLKVHLEDTDELELAGTRYRMLTTQRLDYPLDATLAVLERATGTARAELAMRLSTIDKTRLEALLKELGSTRDRAQVRLLKTELEAIADKSYSPRLWAKEVKS
jgi:hypothetical protein